MKIENKTTNQINDKQIAITGTICTILGIILFFWGINAARENNTGGFRLLSGGIIFSFGVCAFSDIGREEKPDILKDTKDYSQELINELNQHLQVDEGIKKYLTFVEIKASSFVTDQYFGMVAATNKRIIIYKSKLGGHKIQSLNYSKVSSIEYEQGLLFDSLEFSTSGEKLEIDKINKGNTAEFVSFVNSKI